MMLYDFRCLSCEVVFEDLVAANQTTVQCPECLSPSAERMIPAPAVFHEIVPTSKTSKKRKAGYVHSHGDRPKTPGKIQVSVPR